MAKQIDSSQRIAHPPDKGSGRDRLAAIEPHIDVQEHIGKIGDITATRLAAAAHPLSELGRGIEGLQRVLAGPGVLGDLDKRLGAFVDVQERIGKIGDITATRLAAAAHPLSDLEGGSSACSGGWRVPEFLLALTSEWRPS